MNYLKYRNLRECPIKNIKNLLFFPGLYFFLQMVNFASSDLQVVVSSLGAIFQSFQLKRLTSDNKFHIHTTPRAQKCDGQ